MTTRRSQRQWGFVAGAEMLIFGVVTFVLLTLLIIDVWSIIDAKMAVTAAAREGARTYVELVVEPSTDDSSTSAARAAQDALAGRRVDLSNVVVGPVEDGGVFTRCAPVTYEVRARVRLVALPLVGALWPGGVSVVGRHTELIDPFRSGLPGEAACADA